jgi:hypothetical protein
MERRIFNFKKMYMAQIGNVPAINDVKRHLDELKQKGLVREWEIPYENILTRLTAAVFFLSPCEDSALGQIWECLDAYPMFQYRENSEKKLSRLPWRVEFNKGFEL